MKSFGNMIGTALLAVFLVGCAGDRYSRSTGEVIDDRAIHTKVKAALINDPVVAGSSIDVDVNRGVVTLTGAVNGEVAKQKAEQIVVGISGVKSIQNKLLVRQAVGSPAGTTTGSDEDQPLPDDEPLDDDPLDDEPLDDEPLDDNDPDL